MKSYGVKSDLIRATSSNEDDYHKKDIKIKFNSDDDLP